MLGDVRDEDESRSSCQPSLWKGSVEKGLPSDRRRRFLSVAQDQSTDVMP